MFLGDDHKAGDKYYKNIKDITLIGDGKSIISTENIPENKGDLVVINTHGQVRNRGMYN